MSVENPLYRAAYKDAQAAFSIARQLWQGAQPSSEALQSTFATTLIHIQNLRRSDPSHPPAGRAAPETRDSGRPAPSPAPAQGGGEAPTCPVCNGEMWDNRGKKKYPKAPDFRCKDKNCKDENGYTPGVWLKDLGKPKKGRAYVEAAKIRNTMDDFADKPEALGGDDDDLPF